MCSGRSGPRGLAARSQTLAPCRPITRDKRCTSVRARAYVSRARAGIHTVCSTQHRLDIFSLVSAGEGAGKHQALKKCAVCDTKNPFKYLYHMRVYLIAPLNSPSLRRKSSGRTLLLSRSFLAPRCSCGLLHACCVRLIRTQ